MERIGILPDFELPSNPAIKIRLHEATVSDMIDFSEVDLNCEEEATTLFLERLQAKDTYSNPKLWTAEDRRYALFMHHIQTSKDNDIPLTYICESCSASKGKAIQHTVLIKMNEILETYIPIKGKALRDVIYEGHAVIVHPLNGASLEFIEKTRLAIEMWEAEHKKIARKERVRLDLMRLLHCIDIPSLAKDKTEEERRFLVDDFLMAMSATNFAQFAAKVFTALEDMEHGLPSRYINGRTELKTPPITCPENSNSSGLVLWFPFRSFDYMPHL